MLGLGLKILPNYQSKKLQLLKNQTENESPGSMKLTGKFFSIYLY